MTEQFANFAQSTLSSAITATQTTISVASATSFPLLGNFRIVVQSFDVNNIAISQPELMIVTAVAANNFTVTRGAESTKALAFASGARVTHIITAAVMTTLSTGGGTGTVTSVSVATANGVSGSVATPTTTPAISLTLGAITPTSVNSVVLSGSTTPTLAVTGTTSVSGTNTGDQTITLTSDVTGSGTGSFATTIANGVVTLAKMANMATASLIYRKTAGSGAPEVNTLATLKTDLGLTGTNSGDQTITLTGAVTGSGTASFATTIATPGTLTVASTNSTATAHTHAITSSSAPGAAASLLATDASGIIGSTGTRIVKGWFTDITVTNAIAGSITGNAATVTTNANLTGPITSSGNATAIASQTGTGTKFVVDISPTIQTTLTVTGSNAAVLAAGANGATTPALQVNSATASSVTGIAITAAATGGETTVTATDSASDGNISFNAKGNGYLDVKSGTFVTLKVGGTGSVAASSTGVSFAYPFRGFSANTNYLFQGNADTNLTASTEALSFDLSFAQVKTHNTGALTTQRDIRFQPSTHAFDAASTLSDAHGVYINGAPIAGTNATITRSSTLTLATNAVTSSVADSYGLNLSANTGATRNWGAKLAGQLLYASATPGIAAGTGAGTTPTISIAGTNEGGMITLTTGTLPTLSAVVATITYTNAFPNGSSVVLYPANANTATLSGTSMVFTTGNTGTFTLTSGSVALTAATAYKWNYTVIGY